MAVRKQFVTPEQLYKDAYSLAHKVLKSGYLPDIMLVMWRGGSPVGIVVHEYLAYHGIETWHTVIKAQSYTGIASRKALVLENMTAAFKNIKKKSKVLIVDDIFDTGATITAVKKQLKNKAAEIKTAAIYSKTGAPPSRRPDYCVRQTSSWIVFPHELMGLSAKDIKRKGPHIHRLIQKRDGRD